jgi:hypothetical protein
MPCLGVASQMSAAGADARRQLISARTLLAAKISSDKGPARGHESIRGVSSLEKTYRTNRAGHIDAGVQVTLKSHPYSSFPYSSSSVELIRVLQPPDFTPPSSQPCQAWHGYRVTNAHHVEVGVSADGHASAPFSEATAAAPPAGAKQKVTCLLPLLCGHA